MEFSTQKQNKSSQQFSEVDEDLRRIAEREANKQFCPFGDKCYRKNPKHLEEFKHKSNNNNGIKNKNNSKTDEKKAKITDFFNRKPIGIKKLSLERPKDESDYEIEDSDEDNCDKSIDVSNNRLNETPSKKRKFSPFNKDNWPKKTKSNGKKTKTEMKAKTDNKVKYFESDDECDEELKSLLNDDKESSLRLKQINKSPFNKKKDINQSEIKNQTNSPYLKQLESTSFVESSPKNEMINKTPIVSNELQESSAETQTDKTSTPLRLKPKMSPKQLNELIKDIFLVEMPQDFFYLWQFCKSVAPLKPEDAFVEELGFRLVGPYDILTGKVKKSLIKDSDAILCHWRYFYDLPEFQTIIASVKSGYHLGYFRDTPDEENPVIVANNSDKSCVIEGIADNIFAAIYFEIQKQKNKSENKKLSQIELKLKEFCAQNKIVFNANTKLRSRKSKVNAKTFNNFGFVVPVSDTEVGYRPLPQTDSNFKKLLTRICKVDVEERNSCKSLGELQEMIQLVNYANDECDFGMGLELGIDLFCFGDHYFHKSILFLLPLAYHLLNRETFGRIIRAHLKNRRKGFQLDSI